MRKLMILAVAAVATLALLSHAQVAFADDCVVSAGVTQVGTTVTGTPGPDTINCSAALAGHIITGGAEVDTLTGSDFADTINGGDGDDVLVGRGGDDFLTGGAGDDDFVYDGEEDGMDDTADGGDDFDEILFLDAITIGDLIITPTGPDTFDIVVGISGDTIHASNVEQLRFQDGTTVTLIGDADAGVPDAGPPVPPDFDAGLPVPPGLDAAPPVPSDAGLPGGGGLPPVVSCAVLSHGQQGTGKRSVPVALLLAGLWLGFYRRRDITRMW